MSPACCLVAPLIPMALVLGPAAVAPAAESAWSVRVWQSDGLPDRHINGLAQSEDGFLWVGTSYHVARFDGVRFEAFATSDIVPRGMRGFLHAGDHLWVVFNRGPALTFQRGKPPVLVEGLPGRSADVMVEDGEGAVWIGYHDGDVIRIKDGRITAYGQDSGLPDVGSAWLARDDRGRIWYAKSSQVGVFEDGRFRPLVRMPTVSPRLSAARGGGVWIGSGPRLYKYDVGGVLEEKGALPSTHQGSRMSVLLEARDGAVWIGTRHDGLFRRDEHGVAAVPSSHPAIRCLMEDREGNIWVGTGGGGLNRVLPRLLEVEGASTGVSSKLLQSVTEDTSGHVWGVTRNGILVRRRDEAWENMALGPKPLPAATCVHADHRGGLWIGTRSSRLHRWWQGRLTTWGAQQGLRVHGTCAVAATRSGDVWIVGEHPYGGVLRAAVQRLRDGRIEGFPMPDNVRRTFAVAEDPGGAVWIGGAHGVLLRAEGGPPAEVPGASRAVEKQVRALHATADGSIWIGYESGGLGRWKDGRFALLGTEQGLNALDVAQIVGDAADSLWLGTDAGLIRLDRAEVDAVLDGRAKRVRPVEIQSDEGSFTVSAAGCGWSGAIRTRQGEIWMPMGTALLIVHPDRLPVDTAVPRALVTRIGVDGQARGAYGDFIRRAGTGTPSVDLRDTAALSLRPGGRRLEIEFASPTFRAPEDVRFRYRLDGFDDNWVEAGAERTAHYSRLPPGGYRFHVSACTRDSACDESGAALDIAVAPLFWQTWWFRLGSMAAFSAALIAAVRYASFRRLRRSLARLEQQAALDRERTRIARDIHDDVGNRLNRITLLSELALRDGGAPGEMSARVREISSGVREVITALDEVVWAVSPRHDTLPHLVSRIGRFAVDYLRTAGVRCELDLPAHPPDWPVSAEVRHHVLCAVKEALTNSVRHGQPREVKVRVDVAADSFTVLVHDDGRGFDAAPSDAGADGLRNMQQRMAEIGGRMQVTSAPGAGTRVALAVPWPRQPAGSSSIP